MVDLSVIIPVYNVENFLRKCVESIVSQKCSLEILLIDDGSDDSSSQLCEQLASKFSNVFVYHQSNQGVSCARKKGLDLARGRYVTFVDSDDFVDSHMYEILLAKIGDADIIQCAVNYINIEGKIISNTPQISKKILGKDCLILYAQRKLISDFLWDKLYKKELFDGIEFPSFTHSEDYCILTQLFTKASKVVLIPDRLYFYVQHPASVSNQPLSLKWLDYIYAGEYVLSFTTKYCDCLNKYAVRYICVGAFSLYKQGVLEGASSELLNQFYSYFIKYFKINLFLKTPYLCLKLLLLRYFTSVFDRLFKISVFLHLLLKKERIANHLKK